MLPSNPFANFEIDPIPSLSFVFGIIILAVGAVFLSLLLIQVEISKEFKPLRTGSYALFAALCLGFAIHMLAYAYGY